MRSFGATTLGIALAIGLGMLCRSEMSGHLKPAWIQVAEREVFVEEWLGLESHPRILEYHDTTTLDAEDDETPWCSSFVNWCLLRVGIPGTDSALARSWLDWGQELCGPRPGSIVVLQGDRPGAGHVGFLVDVRDGEVLLLGGNQKDRVGIEAYPAGSVLGYRWPSRSAATRF